MNFKSYRLICAYFQLILMTIHTNLKKNLKYRFQSIEIWAPSWCNSGTAFSLDPSQAVCAAVWAPVEAASVPLDLKSHLRLAGHDVEGSAAGDSPGDRARRSSLQVNWRGRGIRRRRRRRDGRVRFAKSFRSATELGARTAHLAGRGRRTRRAGDRRPSRQMLVAPTAPAKWDFSARPFVGPFVRAVLKLSQRGFITRDRRMLPTVSRTTAAEYEWKNVSQLRSVRIYCRMQSELAEVPKMRERKYRSWWIKYLNPKLQPWCFIWIHKNTLESLQLASDCPINVYNYDYSSSSSYSDPKQYTTPSPITETCDLFTCTRGCAKLLIWFNLVYYDLVWFDLI